MTQRERREQKKAARLRQRQHEANMVLARQYMEWTQDEAAAATFRLGRRETHGGGSSCGAGRREDCSTGPARHRRSGAAPARAAGIGQKTTPLIVADRRHLHARAPGQRIDGVALHRDYPLKLQWL